jgi:hypothetical protein
VILCAAVRVQLAWLCIPALLVGAVAAAAPRDWVGAETCAAECHPQVLASWRKTAHARAAASLGERSRDGRCLVCHATGEGSATRSRLAGVQCEACHGPGAAYSPEDVMRDLPLARKLGLRDLSDPAATCSRCHRPDTALSPTPFDATAAWKKIAH